MDPLALVCFFLGFLLLVVEIFVPGFGVPGITGALLVAAGIILVSSSVLMAVLLLILLVILLSVLFIILARSAAKGNFGKRIIQKYALTNKEGFSSMEDLSYMVGCRGKALTILRPAGMADFDGKRMDVQTEGGFVKAGEMVSVLRVEGAKLIVKREE